MSPFDSGRWYPTAPKKPPPEHGIKMKKAGTTWWGERWISALVLVLRGQSGRLERGRTYARAGRTHDVVVKGSKLTAKVTGSRETPYEVTLELLPFSDAVWQQAIAAMAEKAQFSADLLAGEMPRGIDEVFLAAGSSLFPTQRADLNTSCSCPDSGNPCKHVAATHYVLGEALDRDPFLLFELRGRTKSQVLDALRAARDAAGGHASDPGAGKPSRKAKAKPAAAPPRDPATVATVSLKKSELRDYDSPRQALPALQFSFDAPTTQGALLKQLGAPAAWQAQGTPSEVLSPLVRKAAEAARRIALGEPDVEPDANDSAPEAPSDRARRPRRKPKK
jgi:uncharacterized Zn finger protein